MIRKPAAILLVLSLAKPSLPSLRPCRRSRREGWERRRYVNYGRVGERVPEPGTHVQPCRSGRVRLRGQTCSSPHRPLCRIHGGLRRRRLAPDVLTPTSLPQNPARTRSRCGRAPKQEAEHAHVAGIDGSDRHLAQKEQLAESPGPRPATWPPPGGKTLSLV